MMECQIKKYEHFRHLLFAINQGSKAARAAENYSGDFYQRGIENHVERSEVASNNQENITD